DLVTVATVSENGLVTAVSPGTATITATSEGKAATATITVTRVPVASVAVTLAANSITSIGTTQATAALADALGTPLSGREVNWSSSNSSVATADASGLVTAAQPGSTDITATSEGTSSSATQTVTEVPVATVT